jgi:hypothetical protein
MELHCSKFQLLQVRGDFDIKTPNGERIEPSESMVYLGSTLYADGGAHNELAKKLGKAWADFSKLARVWKHAQISRQRKIEAFQSMVVSRLLYGLSTAWMNVAHVRRLNGFQARCLRAVLGIQHSYFSRVSNITVLERAGQKPLGRQLLKQQMLLYGRVARAPASDLLRNLAFVPGTLSPATSRYVRRVGRPQNEWTVMLQKESYKMSAAADRIIHSPIEWRTAVEKHCMSRE